MSALIKYLTVFVYVFFTTNLFSINFDDENIIRFSIYQNKAEGYLKVRLYEPLEQKIRITVYNIDGKPYYISYLVVNANSVISVDVSYFESGLYTLCVESDKNESSKEILID
jgi:Secretion system C-terminal sorting domain